MPRPHVAAAVVLLLVLTVTTAFGLLYGRPLPTIDGHYRFLGLHARAEVIRDEFGIPRIYASDAHDLFFLQGYITAQDRFAQMEAMRTEARSHATADGSAFPGPLREALEAYAAGVTKYIEQHREHRALPAEVVLSRRSLAPWSAADSLGIAATYLAAGGSTTCVAVSGVKALRGRPLLAVELGGPVPAPGWYEIGLDASAGDAQGVGISLPGVPGILAGHNAWIAWAATGIVGSETRHAVEDLLLFLSARSLATIAPVSRSVDGCAAELSGEIRHLGRLRLEGGVLLGAGSGQLTEKLAGPIAPDARIDLDGLRAMFGLPAASDGSARIIVDLGDVDASKAAVSVGQSAHRTSKHYRDQTALWEAGQLHRLAWTRGAVRRIAAELVLRPR